MLYSGGATEEQDLLLSAVCVCVAMCQIIYFLLQ
jgi:hypothetical protein